MKYTIAFLMTIICTQAIAAQGESFCILRFKTKHTVIKRLDKDRWVEVEKEYKIKQSKNEVAFYEFKELGKEHRIVIVWANGGETINVEFTKKISFIVPKDNRSYMMIEIPVDAKLYIDNNLVERKEKEGNYRHFRTPPLERNMIYYYKFRMVPKKGSAIHIQKRFKGGEVVRVNFVP